MHSSLAIATLDLPVFSRAHLHATNMDGRPSKASLLAAAEFHPGCHAMHASQVALVRPRDKLFGASPTNLGNMHPTVTTLSESARLARALAPQRSTVILCAPKAVRPGKKGGQHRGVDCWSDSLLLGCLRAARSPIGGCRARFSRTFGLLGRRLPQIFPAEYLDLYRLIVRDLLVVQSLFTEAITNSMAGDGSCEQKPTRQAHCRIDLNPERAACTSFGAACHGRDHVH